MTPATDGDETEVFTFRKNTGFKQIRPEDDLLHPASFGNVKDESATETQYFGFSVPEANIFCYAYLWHHPNLGVVTGGLFAFQGIKHATPQAELCDYRTFMSDATLKNDLHQYRFSNGYGVKILEPLKRFHMTYDDPATKNSVDVIFEGVQPPVLFDDGRHFEQTMHVTGELVLRGKAYPVDCFTIRDRSWGAARSEASMEIPPMSWICVTYGKDFAFNCTVFDQAGENPGPFAVPDEKALSNGWVYRDGKLSVITQARKRIVRDGLVCSALDLQFTDETGRRYEMTSKVLASCPVVLWNNMWTVINLLRWECDGLVGDGTNQEASFNSYLATQT